MFAQQMAPPESAAQTNGTHLTEGVRDTAIGWIAALWREDDGESRLLGITIGHDTPAKALAALPDEGNCQPGDELSDQQKNLLDRLAACADGQVDSFADIALNLDHLAPFARKVVERCHQIPAGETMTYAQLAAACGSPNAARAVGNVMASNRFPMVVPCHRVVGSGGGLGGFSAPRGVSLKRELLQREGVEI